MEKPVQDIPDQGIKPGSFFAKDRTWLNILLFIATVFSTFFVGFSLSINYKYAEIIVQGADITLTPDVILDSQILVLNIIYAAALIGILLGHELGHFLTCRYYRINATLPFFIPAPTIIGTLGAFIKIKSPITQKKQVFDIGSAGPLTGFLLSVPLLILGLLHSKAMPSLPREGSLFFGEPLLLKIIGGLVFKGMASDFDIILHPLAFAGWVGVLVTALNLFPIGQLDGGHIFYAMLGPKSTKYAKWILGVFVVLGIFFWIGWFVWALVIGLLGVKHPRIIDEDIPLSPGRKAIGLFIILIFIFSFIPDPIKGYDLLQVMKQFSF